MGSESYKQQNNSIEQTKFKELQETLASLMNGNQQRIMDQIQDLAESFDEEPENVQKTIKDFLYNPDILIGELDLSVISDEAYNKMEDFLSKLKEHMAEAA